MRPRFSHTSRFIRLVCFILCYSLVSPLPAFTTRPSAVIARAAAPAVPAKTKNVARTTNQTTQKARWRDSELLVRFREHAPVSKLNQLLRTNGAQWNGQLRGESGIERLRLSAGLDPEAVAAALRASDLVDFAEPNYLITADQTPTQTATNDPRFSEQWALRSTGTPPAWAITTGSKQTVIAIIDSGIDFTHPELINNQWDNTLEQANNLDNDSNGFNSDLHGWDFVTNTGTVIDEQGHGTAVAGIIAASGNNATGISGVMWHAGLMNLRVLDSAGTGDVAHAVEAIDYAVENGAQIINCSWSTHDASTALREAINRAAQHGVIVVTSAGNQSRDIETTPRYPASFDLPNLISVASTDSNDLMTSFSNWGMMHVSIAAPGTEILTTKIGGDYQTISGSSASTAFVTGVAGLIKTLRPWLNAARTREMILRGARQVPSLSDKVASKGIISAAGALDSLNTLPQSEGLGEGDGNNGGEHGNNNGRGNQRDNRPGRGRTNHDDRHRDGHEFTVIPAARTQGAPGSGLPDLDLLKRQQPTKPKAAPPIPSTRCSHHDPQCDRGKRKAAINKPLDLLAWYSGIPSDADPAQPLPFNLLALNSGPALPHFLKDYSTPIISDSSPYQMSRFIPGNALLLAALPQASTYKIAFTSNRDGSSQLYLMNSDGSNQTRLTNNSANDESPRWSPDNTRILFQSDRDNPSSGAAEIYVMNADATAQTRLTNNTEDDSCAVWSPTGNKIAFQSLRNDLYYQVYVMNSDGSNQVNISNGTTNDGQPSWSPDGTKIAFTSERDHPGTPSIYVMNTDGSSQTRLTFSAAGIRDEQPSWSPDGTKLLFTSTRDSVVESWQETDDTGGIINRTAVRTNKEVYVMNSNGSNQIRLTNNLENDDSPAWSSDGTKIVFRSERERDGCDPVQQVWVMNADGTNQVDLFNSWFGDYAPNWQRVAGGNLPPTVSLSSPASGTTLTALANVTITANASDSDGTISKVEFYQGTTLIGTDTTAPYSIAWNNVAQGAYSIVAKATDNSGAVTTSSPAGITVVDFSSARVDPFNRTGSGGVDLLSGNANWSLPVLGLKGRAGLDLGLSLSYNSLVWTKGAASNSIMFDADRGMPSPGFRLGFPVIQPRYYNSQVSKYAYLLVTPSGSHTELRQVETSNVYESADSSYLQLKENGSSLTLKPTDGSQLTYSLINGQYLCREIKDRNGNYITINYDAINNLANAGLLTSIVDTLGRTINFNYDTYLNLISITQDWGGGVTHTWATFGWGTQIIQTSFIGMTVLGPPNGTSIPVLTQVSLDDGSRYNFEYNSYAQVYLVRHYAFDNHQRSYSLYTLPASSTDCPRVSESHEWAENWNNDQEATTTYTLALDHSSGQVTMPDTTTSYKELFATTGWQRGLTTGTEYWSSGVKKKWTMSVYTQDNTSSTFQQNPRVIETNIYDSDNNRKRTTIDYGSGSGPGSGQYAKYGLPYVVTEYAADGSTPLRSTFTDYNLDTAYVNNRIIGLVSMVHVSNGSAWQSKVVYAYDEGGDQLQATSPAATQHDDANRGIGYTIRGNVTSVSRYDVNFITDDNKALTTRIGYDTDGSVIFSRDPLNHQTSLSYIDSFADNVNRHTFAYPTTATDADGYASTVQYNYDFGATTRTQSPAPAGQSAGPIQTMEYDAAGRITKVNNLSNGAWKLWAYPDRQDAVQTLTTINSTSSSNYQITVVDGAGRVRAEGGDLPNSDGLYRGAFTEYDVMGRVSRQSNPAEMTSAWAITGLDAEGWNWTQQQYDWKGRPTLTTLPSTDGVQTSATRLISYGGCGCAGGEVVTTRDEVGRQQRMTADVLGRAYKTEVLNWDGSVYSTVVNTYNARDQLTNSRHYQGTEISPTYQESVLVYDGYGRLLTSKSPEQTSPTSYSYNQNGTTNTVTDARGATATLSYNNRHLVTGISFSAPTGISPALPVAFTYDAAGNRTSMTDSMGSVSYSYDQLSRLSSETRTFTNVGSFTLSYEYNLTGELKKIKDATGSSIAYDYDSTGRLNTVTGSDTLYAGVSNYASNLQYRAWGGIRQMQTGDSRTTSLIYNTRLEATHFEVNGVVSQNIDYNADGRVGFIHNLLDSNFDRSYSFDHLGRLSEAKTGGAARSDYGATPYYESFNYNVWGDTTSRFTNTWDQQSFDDAASYTNGKRDDWGYDEDGRNTSIDARNYQFDAGGRQVLMSGQRWLLSHYVPASLSSDYDGDGLKVKESNTISNSTAITYYLRSSVLGGAIIEEIGSNGEKQAGYVYAGAELLARQANNEVVWKHQTPNQTAQFESHANGTVNRIELDPVGADVGVFAPPVPDTNGRDGDIGSNHMGGLMDSRYADLTNISGGCMIDGMAASCSQAARIVNSGAGVMGPSSTTRWNRNTRRFEFFHAYADASGWMAAGASYRGAGRVWVSDSGTQRNDGDRGDTIVINRNEDALGHWESISTDSVELTSSQNSGRNDLPDFARSVYHGKLGYMLRKCINKVFSKDITRAGITSAGANFLPRQTIANAPLVDQGSSRFQLGGADGMHYVMGSVYPENVFDEPNKIPGIINVASDIEDQNNPTTGQTVTAFELEQRTFVHELGNILSLRLSGNGRDFGDPNGVPHAWNKKLKGDDDAGAKLEKCVFGNMVP
jgi:YD repeat-containing protein